jgi:hypothetical protein
LEKSKKVLIAGLVLIGLLVGLVVVWFVTSQPPPYQKVPFSYLDFEDYPSELVVNRSEGHFIDFHVAIASGNRYKDVYIGSVFVGLKLTGFAYIPSVKIGNDTFPEEVVVERLDALATSGIKGFRIEELNLSCEFNESLGEKVWSFFSDTPEYNLGLVAYNLELVNATRGYALPSEPFVAWKGIGYCTGGSFSGFFTNRASMNLNSYENSTTHDFVLTLKLAYSYNPSTRYELSTSLHIIITD